MPQCLTNPSGAETKDKGIRLSRFPMTFPPYLRNGKKNHQTSHVCKLGLCVTFLVFFFVWKTTTTRGGVFQTQAPSEIPQEAAEPWVGGGPEPKVGKKSWMIDDGP